ncbi:MAG: glycosyltransferase [Alcaligenaceae bacterium]|nr:MAG: glycosyltransferase [Alcaligenaceae bacterium]
MDSKDGIKVLFFDHSSELGGAEIALLQSLPRMSRVAPVLLCGANGAFSKSAIDSGIETEVCGGAPTNVGLGGGSGLTFAIGLFQSIWSAIRMISALTGNIRRVRPEILYCNTLRAGFLGGPVARLCGIAVVWHVRDTLAPPYLPRATAWCARALIRMTASVVVANSEFTAGFLGDMHPRVVGSPISDVFYKKRHIGPVTGTRFVMVGRLAAWKGQLEAIRAFAFAFPNGQAQFRIFGAPLFGQEAYAERLADEIARLGMTGRIELRGHSDDIAGEMAVATAVVHASVMPEPLGQVTVQAAAVGAPLIVADGGWPGLAFDDFETARFHIPGDVGSLAEAMSWINECPTEAKEMADRGRAIAESYRAETITRQMEDLLIECSGHAPTVSQDCQPELSIEIDSASREGGS